MKKLKLKIILVPVFIFTLGSCSDFLDEVDYSNISGDSYFPTEEGIESLVKGCYSPMRFYYGKEHSIVYTEMGTDIFTAASGMVSNPYAYYTPDMIVMGFKGNGEDKNTDYWRYFYLGLNNTNAAIARIPGSSLPEGLRQIREGEARFLRAFYLWHIVNIWGGVHFTTEETKSAGSELNRTDESVFWDQIIEDLEIAVDYLPPTTTEYGRVTKPAAQAFLARSYLYVKDYEKAFQFADAVITEYGFELEDNYADLWDPDNEQNEEIIWSVIWSENNLYSIPILDHQDQNDIWMERAEGNQLHLFFVMVYQNLSIDEQVPVARDLVNGRAFSRFMPTKFLVNLFDESMDSRFDATFQSVWYCNTPIVSDTGDTTMHVGDTAIYISKYPVSQAEKDAKDYIYFDINDLYDPVTGLHPGVREHYYTMRKFLDPTRDPEDVNDQSSKFDTYVFRLAEMYFIAAEAQMYLEDNDKAAEYINEIRRRAALPGMEDAMEIDAADINIDFILDEKAREFAGEYIRWFDLKRTDKLVERVKLHNPDAAPNIQPHHRVRPIPQSELNAVTNRDEFHQNEGYVNN